MGGFILTHSLRGEVSITAGKARLWEHEVASHMCLESEAEIDECWCSALFPFTQSLSDASETVPPTLEEVFAPQLAVPGNSLSDMPRSV